MALSATIVFNVRTDGSDSNGGGYKSDAGTTDYSLQASPQLSLTDCATSAVGSTTLTSATGGFTSAMVGNLINLSAGTNLTTGVYQITAYTNTNTVTLDRAPGSGGAVSGATGKVGGALLSPGYAAALATGSGHIIYIKAGTYTLTTTTPGIAGPVSLTSGGRTLIVEGYDSAPGDGTYNTVVTLDAGALTSFTMVKIFGGTSNPQICRYIRCDGQGNTGVIGFEGIGSYPGTDLCQQCFAIDCASGFIKCSQERCYASGCSTAGFSRSWSVNCTAYSCTTGFEFTSSGSNSATNCIAKSCSGYGFSITTFGIQIHGCVAVDNGNHGFYSSTWSPINSWRQCVSYGNTGYGFYSGASSVPMSLINCAAGGNSSGACNTSLLHSIISLSTSPFVSSSDHSPHPVDGYQLRSAVTVAEETAKNDIGAVQHRDPIKRTRLMLAGKTVL